MEYKWVALSITSLGSFMASLDTRILVVGFPTLSRELGIGVSEVVWVTQVYVLTITVLSMLIGRTGDQIGRVKLFSWGFIVFTIGSALSALSFNGYELIASRVVQGAGSALLISNVAAMLTDIGKGRSVGALLGMNNVATTVGAIAGLTLSGVILSLVDWRGLFYVNIPIGIFGSYLSRRKLVEIATRDTQKSVDWSGLLTFSSGLTLLMLGLTFLSYGLAGFSPGISMVIAGSFLLLAFVLLEANSKAPLLDMRLFKLRTFAAGNLGSLFNNLAWFGFSIFISLYLQIGLGMSALSTGLELVPMQLAIVVAATASGRLTDRYGHYSLICILGSVISFSGLALLAYAITDPGPYLVTAALMLFGAGCSIYGIPNRSAILSSVVPGQRGIASGFSTTVNYVSNSMSYGFIILLMTLIIPYGTLSALIQGNVVLGGTMMVRLQFFDASRFVIYVLAALLAISAVPAFFLKTKSATNRTELSV